MHQFRLGHYHRANAVLIQNLDNPAWQYTADAPAPDDTSAFMEDTRPEVPYADWRLHPTLKTAMETFNTAIIACDYYAALTAARAVVAALEEQGD